MKTLKRLSAIFISTTILTLTACTSTTDIASVGAEQAEKSEAAKKSKTCQQPEHTGSRLKKRCR